MKLNFFLLLILRLIVGSTFLFSAYTKLYPVEMFELKLVETNLINWYLAPFIARFFISVEFILGIFLILNIKQKIILKIILGMLLFFTGYLLFRMAFYPDEKDCGCFGVFIKMSNGWSVVKNLVLLTISFFLIKLNVQGKIKFPSYLIIGFVIVAISLPYILNPVNIMQSEKLKSDRVGYKLDLSLIGEMDNKAPIHLGEEKKIVCFFSMHCRFCKLTAQKIRIIENKLGRPLPVYFLFFGDPGELDEFWEETRAKGTPYKILPVNNFFKLSGNALPSIYFLENGAVIKKYEFLTLSQEEVESFLKNTENK